MSRLVSHFSLLKMPDDPYFGLHHPDKHHRNGQMDAWFWPRNTFGQ